MLIEAPMHARVACAADGEQLCQSETRVHERYLSYHYAGCILWMVVVCDKATGVQGPGWCPSLALVSGHNR